MPATLDTPERWRSWLDNGLSHVLGPLPWVEAFQEQALAEKVAAPGRPTAQSGARFGAESVLGQAAKKQAIANIPSRSHFANLGQGTAIPQIGVPPQQDGTSPAQGALPQRPLPVSSWPEAWQAAWSKTGFARPFLWTYAQLGEDLLGTADPARRAVLRDLLIRLNLGSKHNFWPFSEPDGQGGLRLQPRLFREGVLHLAPKCVIFLGSEQIEEVTVLGATELFKVMSYFDTGVLCVHTPGIQELAEDRNLLDAVVELFQQKLTPLI